MKSGVIAVMFLIFFLFKDKIFAMFQGSGDGDGDGDPGGGPEPCPAGHCRDQGHTPDGRRDGPEVAAPDAIGGRCGGA